MCCVSRWALIAISRRTPPRSAALSPLALLAEFEQAYLSWLKTHLPDKPFIAAVDAKTSRQGIDTDGQPVQLVTVLMHELKLVIAQWSVRGDKTNESGVLKLHLAELREQFPLLTCFSGDAIYATRPLAEATLAENCDYLVQIKNNQHDVREAMEHCLGGAHERPPAAMTAEKRGSHRSAAAVA